MLTEKECRNALSEIENKLKDIFGEESEDMECLKVLNQLIKEHFDKETPTKPLDESKQDKICPKCGAYLSFDALNDPVVAAPNCCSSCGQRIDWSDFEK